MDGKLKRLVEITNMCLKELQQAQENCQKYSVNMTMMTKEIESNLQDNSYLTKYDAFITKVSSIMDTTRVFNLQLKLCDISLSEGHKLCKDKQTKIEENNRGYIEVSKSFYFPAEEYDLSTEGCEDCAYRTPNLSAAYKPNDVINGTVTYVKSLKDSSFFIFDYTSQYCSAVAELSKSLKLRQYQKQPAVNEIFGCVLDNQIFRAVLFSKSFYDDEMNEEILPCYLLDTGEILPIKRDFIMYKLTDEQKKIPALALPCQLAINKNPFKRLENNKLEDIEYKKCRFKIIAIENNILVVDIMDNFDVESQKNTSDEHIVDNVTNEIKSERRNKLQLTEEELEMIYEEPFNTSNAMKAVMGYDPQDDKRICRFYDPSTGGCFKGVNCRLEHTPREPDGWTKDILPSLSIVDSRHPITIFTTGSIINITPTYVGQLDRFYAQINEPNKSFSPLIWNDEDVPLWKLLHKPPHMFELVLCRYVDGLWYRAKIMSHDDEYKWFKVLYVDYGNVQMVHLRNIAAIDHSTAVLPFQAILCRFNNVNENSSLSIEERKNCIELLCEMILNKTMNVKVLSHYEDLFISFEDKEVYPLPDLLIEMGVLDQKEDEILP